MIEDFREVPFTESKFLTPKRVKYVEKGQEKVWDVVESHDSVSVLIYNEDKQSYCIVKQFRPPIKHAHPEDDGYVYELCSGIVDRDKTLEQIAIEECLEECGYKVPNSKITYLTTVHSMVGLIGAKQTWYYASVKNEDKVSNGGGIYDENIEVVYIPESELESFFNDESKPKTAGLTAILLFKIKGV